MKRHGQLTTAKSSRQTGYDLRNRSEMRLVSPDNSICKRCSRSVITAEIGFRFRFMSLSPSCSVLRCQLDAVETG